MRRSPLREAAARARARTPLRRGAPAGVERGSAWAPLRHSQFRSLWTAQLVSNVGTWMQTVGAQWLMLSLNPSPLMVALVQTSISLPIVLLALPAGALGDVFDRRRVLMTSQAMMLVGAAVLATLTLAHVITAWSLLALTFSIGLGDALRRPAWQAIQPELVPRELIPQAAALNSTSVNMARAVGPAIGGAIVASAGPGWVFMANSASFLGVLGVLAVWHRERRQSALGPERIGAAVRAGARYARSSPRLRAVLARTALFLLFGSSLWALLPVAAHSRLGLGSGGYGLLLASVGAGALLGAVILPSLRETRSANAIVTGQSLVFAAAAAALAWFAVVPVAVVALVAAGFAWIATVSSLNASAQTILPSWVRARGMALFLLVVQGGQALGSVAWGFVAEHSDVQVAFTAVAGGLVLGLVFAVRYPVRSGEDLDLTPSRHWREPELAIERDPSAGPVLVTIGYRVPLENHEAFRDAMQAVGRSRRRSGAERWGLFQEATDPDRFVEAFVVPSWEEHLRQHERLTVADRQFEERARELVADGHQPEVTHLLST